MTGGQWRVLGILLVILGIEAATSKDTRKVLGAAARLDVAGLTGGAAGGAGALFGFALSALALVAIAAWQEGIATGIAALFLLVVLINRSDAIAPAVKGASDALINLSGKRPGGDGRQGK